jgi:hypothetical protein
MKGERIICRTKFTLPRCATGHKPDIQRYKGRAIPQIATLFERAAWSERSLGKAVALACFYFRDSRHLLKLYA